MTRLVLGCAVAASLACGPTKGGPPPPGPSHLLIGGVASNDESVIRIQTQSATGNWFICSGVLVGSGTGVLLTAAHCVVDEGNHDSELPPANIALSSNDRSWTGVPTDVRIVSPADQGDLAVLYAPNLNARPSGSIVPRTLTAPVSFLSYETGYGLSNQTVTAYGYGETVAGQGSMDVQTTGTETIAGTLGFLLGAGKNLSFSSPNYLEVTKGSTLSCQGDSGGPIFLGDTVIGIVHAGGVGCDSYSLYSFLGRETALLTPYLNPDKIPAPGPLDANASSVSLPRGTLSSACADAPECASCASDEVCDADSTGACGCLPALDCPTDCGAGCDNDQVCAVDDDECASCAPAQPTPTDPCDGECLDGEACVLSLAGYVCLVDPCDGSCQDDQTCVEGDSGWGCQSIAADPCSGACDATETCAPADDGSYGCIPNPDSTDMCNNSCVAPQSCDQDADGNWSCQTFDPCNGACAADQSCAQQGDGSYGCGDPCGGACLPDSQRCQAQADGTFACVDQCNDGCQPPDSCQQAEDDSWGCADPCGNACADGLSCQQAEDGSWSCQDACGGSCTGDTSCQIQDDGSGACIDGCGNTCDTSSVCTPQADGSYACQDQCGGDCAADTSCQPLDGDGGYGCVDNCGNSCDPNQTCLEADDGTWSCSDNCDGTCTPDQTCAQDSNGDWVCM